MKFQSLASSSEGNAYVVSDGTTELLIECGLGPRKLAQALGFRMAQLDGCLVSHEHKDHCKAVEAVIKSGVPVYLSQGTAAALELPEALLDMAAEMEAGVQFSVGSMEVLPFPTYHDAQEPLGFVIQSRADEDVLAFITDTVNVPYNFPGVGILAVEANFQRDILDRCQKMPEKTRHRISNTHMEIDRLCACLKRMDLSQCRELYLLHLSSATSHEGQFINKVRRVVPKGIRIMACQK